MDGTQRSKPQSGLEVEIVQKQDHRSGVLTRGVVRDILTNSSTHLHGIKVRLETGGVVRVKHIHSQTWSRFAGQGLGTRGELRAIGCPARSV